jgi:hypothetical protein
MSALGHERTLQHHRSMSVILPKADIRTVDRDVCNLKPMRCSEKRLFDHAARRFVT